MNKKRRLKECEKHSKKKKKFRYNSLERKKYRTEYRKERDIMGKE